MTHLLDRMVSWVVGLTWADVPAPVQERALDAVRDTVSTMVGGTSTSAAGIAFGFAAEGIGAAPLSGRGRSTTASLAAFGNGVAASALDYDDGHYLAGAIHPGSVVVPAILACADAETTLEEAGLALVVGYEVGLRAASQLWGRHEDDLYHATGCAGAIAAAVASAKLRGLDADELTRAVKIAWVHAPMSTFGTPMVKESIGWGSMAGVAATDLAKAGFMATPAGYTVPPNDVLVPSPFHRRGAAEDPMVTSFGRDWLVLGTYFKSFAACRYTHAAAAGLSSLIAEHGVDPADIRSIRVGTHQAATFLDEISPQTIDTAQYSFPIVLASVAVWGDAGPAEISDESRLNDPDRQRLAKLVRLEHDADLDQHYPARYPSRVAIETSAGTVEGVYLDAPGDPGTDFGPTELRTKWRALLASELGEDDADTVLAGLENRSAPLLATLAPVWAARP